MRASWVTAVSLAAVVAVSDRAAAQRAEAVRAGVARRVPPALAPVMSAVLPGSGQFLQRRDRGVAYAAVEVLAWWKLARDVSERSRQAAEFKELARTVARAHLSPTGPEGDWRYYEMMRDYLESGSYSTSTTQLVPETDPSTHNGRVWQIALATNPDSAHALAQYAEQAYKGDMLWSWRNAQLQFDVYRRSTEKRNDANAAVGTDATIIVLNHLLSMVDAFAAFRLDTYRMSDGRRAVGARIEW